MDSSDQYNFSLFKPRNFHGKKNRNVILTLLAIWVTAVFGFQLLLRVIEKPVPEKALTAFRSVWPQHQSLKSGDEEYRILLHSLVQVRGKNTVKPEAQKVISAGISTIVFNLVPDTTGSLIRSGIREMVELKGRLAVSHGQEYLDTKSVLLTVKNNLSALTSGYTGFMEGSLESSILLNSISEDHPESLSDEIFSGLPGIMELYLIHNQSFLTDATFLGFPFHYFYTAVFLLILFVILCIVYIILVERRLKSEGIVE